MEFCWYWQALGCGCAMITYLTAANASYKMIKQMSEAGEVVGPIQMGLNKPIHFTDFESSVRDIVNITAVAVIDAIVQEKKDATDI